MPVKLNQVNLPLLDKAIAAPRYDRRQVGQSIAHIGVGGFHRSHQAVYAENLFHQGEDLRWGLCGLGLLQQDARMRDVLRSQDCLYTLVERGAAGDSARVVGSIVQYLFAPDDPEAVIEKLAAPETKIASLTITEGGYYLQTGTGRLDAGHPDLRHDLAHPHQPACSFGFLLEALDRRRRRGQGPFTVLSCDNIQGNGDVAKRMLLAFAELRDPALARWMAENCAFPNSMVDRITPATTEEHRALVRDKFGIDDGWPVTAEPFRQWVIEDHFVQGRPRWEKAGAQMTGDVLPYEKMKLRLLNAGHQALCYIGLLLGYEFVHQTMRDPDIRRLVELMMDREVTDLLAEVPGVDLGGYKKTLIERFANPAIRDQLLRIGIYGSMGMPKFVLPSIEEQLKRGGPIRLLSFVAACWFRCLGGRDEQGREILFKDPMGPKLRELARAGGNDPGRLLALREIFSEELAGSPRFLKEVGGTLGALNQNGARATLVQFIST
jgi:mannitol 2-dehydrogenase